MLSRVCVPAGVPPGVLPAPGVLLAPGVPLPWRVVFPPLDESAFTSRKPPPPNTATTSTSAIRQPSATLAPLRFLGGCAQGCTPPGATTGGGPGAYIGAGGIIGPCGRDAGGYPLPELTDPA